MGFARGGPALSWRRAASASLRFGEAAGGSLVLWESCAAASYVFCSKPTGIGPPGSTRAVGVQRSFELWVMPDLDAAVRLDLTMSRCSMQSNRHWLMPELIKN